jgi:glycosyltransferase involved in cell wall biosynthesis
MVEDGVTGRLVPPHDPDALAAAILCVLSASQRSDLGAAARERLVHAFPYDRFLTQVEEVVTYDY